MSRPNQGGNKMDDKRLKSTDAEVLEARRLYEKEGKTQQEVADVYGWELSYTKQILTYTIRSRLIK